MSKPVVTIRHVSKTFEGQKQPAIQNLSLSLESGQIIGLVGPDGAGKTTLIRLLLGLLLPGKGEISVLGLDPVKQTDALHGLIGYMPQKFGLYEDLTVQENMNLYADLKGLSAAEKKEQFETLLRFTGLAPFTNRLAGRLSGGMKQKLGLGCSLLGHPRFLLLDEPGVGVDPISRRELMKMVRGLAQDGITILWSTSYLDEAEHFDTVLVLDEGKLLYAGPPANLTKTVAGDAFFVQRTRLAPRPLLRSILKSGIPVTDAVIWGNQVRVVIQDKAVQKKFARYLKPTSARFEDAVINRLGGCPLMFPRWLKTCRFHRGKRL